MSGGLIRCEFMINRRRLLKLAGSIVPVRLSLASAHAQGLYPDHSIRLIVPRAASGSVDVIAREWSDKVKGILGASYVENMGGGGGRIGAMAAARAPADGYTLLIGSTSELVLIPLLSKQSYDPVKDFTPISILSTSPLVIAINPSIPARDLKELVTYAKANPGKINYGSAGTGSLSNVAGELFKQSAGLPDAVHIPYKGASATLADLMGGTLTFSMPSISANVIDLHRAGKIRIVAVTSEERVEAARDLPTAIEQGFPAVVALFFVGLFAPAGVPPALLEQLEQVTHAAMQDKDLQMILANAGFEIPDSNRVKAAEFLRNEIVKWEPVLKNSGIQPE
jgi:tripartite-type tricarboxylate transporter receptor subunit TctC